MKLTDEIKQTMNCDPAPVVVERIHEHVDAAARLEIEKAVDELWRAPALEAVVAQETELAARKARLIAGTIQQPIGETPGEELLP